MADNDRTLLEKAAGAFGVPPREEGGYMYAGPGEISQSGWGIVTWCGLGTVQYWNPLESNDDAFRLAVKLRLSVHFSGHRFNVGTSCYPPADICCEGGIEAVRYGIVRAAASLSDAEGAK